MRVAARIVANGAFGSAAIRADTSSTRSAFAAFGSRSRKVRPYDSWLPAARTYAESIPKLLKVRRLDFHGFVELEESDGAHDIAALGGQDRPADFDFDHPALAVDPDQDWQWFG